MPRKSISVVIPTFSAQRLLEKHLPDVQAILTKGDEVVIVDDASTDNTVEWVEKQIPLWKKIGIELMVVEHTKNQRFAAAVNSGVKAATKNFIFLLNNDVSPLSPMIVETLLEWFSERAMFAVGCAEVTTRKSNASVSGRGTGNFVRGFLAHWYDSDQTSNTTLWTTGGSMMFDRAKFLELGGMDTLFYPAYEEDRDLSYRALKNGWKIAFEPQAIVLHQHETTNKSIFGERHMTIVSWKNQFLLVWKNITDPQLFLQHLFWLPFHLTVTNLRTGGLLGRGFFRALQQLPAAHQARKKTPRQRSDQEVLTEYGSQRPENGIG